MMLQRAVSSSRALQSGLTLSRAVLSQRRSLPLGRWGVACRCMSEDTDSSSSSSGDIPKYQVQPFDRFVLIATRTMKPGEIPNEISREVLEKAQSRRRIMINMALMFFTALGSIYAIRRGRKARDSGEATVLEKNLQKYDQYQEKAEVSAKKE